MFKIKNGFIVRKIGDRIMAVPIGTQTSELHGMITLSESGELLWRALENGATIEELVKIITREYEVDCVTAENDVKDFVEQLRFQGVLQ